MTLAYEGHASLPVLAPVGLHGRCTNAACTLLHHTVYAAQMLLRLFMVFFWSAKLTHL